jgi:hemolysin III
VTAQIDDLLAPRPLLRGVLHGGAFVASCVIGIVFVLAAPDGRLLPALAFAVSAAVMLGTSTIYHRVRWKRTAARLWMRRADHAGIFLLIAGTYTPVGLISLHGSWRVTILAIVWSGAAAAVLVKMCWVRAPKLFSASFGVLLGWAGVAALPEIVKHDGLAPVILLAAGGLAYTAGAVVYAVKRPDPFPKVFGYHELFHALTIGALACQYVAVAFFVVRVG